MTLSNQYQYAGGVYILACKHAEDAAEFAAARSWRLAEWRWLKAAHRDVIVFRRVDVEDVPVPLLARRRNWDLRAPSPDPGADWG